MIKENEKYVPEISGTLRNHIIEAPSVIRRCSGIKIFGKRIKSIMFSTDVAMIKNTGTSAAVIIASVILGWGVNG